MVLPTAAAAPRQQQGLKTALVRRGHTQPLMARDLFEAFAAAKRIGVRRLREGPVDAASPTDQMFQRPAPNREPVARSLEPV